MIESPFMTTEQAAAFCGVSKESIYSAKYKGLIRSHKIGRRSLYERKEIEAYRKHLDYRYESRVAAKEAYAKQPTRPQQIDERHWRVFVEYATTEKTYDQIGQDEHLTRQRVQQIVRGVIAALDEL